LSKISLQPNASGTGTFTLAAPDSNTNRTLTLPDEAGTVATVENLPAGYTDSDALDLFNATGSAPVYACRAWVNFDGAGTVSIRASGNVSSITDNGTGDYTVNFATAMPDANYAVSGSANTNAGNSSVGLDLGTAPTSSAFRIGISNTNSGALFDSEIVTVIIFR